MKPEGEDELGVRIAINARNRPLFTKIRKGLIDVLNKFGGYLPEVDEILIDEISSSIIYSREAEVFLDADSATEHTYTRMADVKAKFQKMINDALRELALTRRDRLNNRGQSDLMNQLREAILRSRKK